MKLSITQENLYNIIKDLFLKGEQECPEGWISESEVKQENNYKSIRSSSVWKLVNTGKICIQIYKDMVEYSKSYNFGRNVVHTSRPESYFKFKLNTSGKPQKEVSVFCSSFILAPDNSRTVNTETNTLYKEYIINV